jgi:hypothetical protein
MKTILAAILGGIAVFVWNAVSWMALSWHEPTIRQFTEPAQISQSLVEQAPSSGIYVLNHPQSDASSAPGDESAAPPEPAAGGEAGANQPFAFVAFTREGFGGDQMPRQFAYALGANILTALMIVFLLRATSELSYPERVTFIATVGVIIAVAGRLPNWIWWHYPRDFMVVDIADVIIGWSLAALVMAALTGPENTRPGLSYRRVRL